MLQKQIRNTVMDCLRALCSKISSKKINNFIFSNVFEETFNKAGWMFVVTYNAVQYHTWVYNLYFSFSVNSVIIGRCHFFKVVA